MWPVLAEEGSELLISVLRNMISGTVRIYSMPSEGLLMLAQQPDAVEQDIEAATDAPAIDGVIANTNWWEWDAKRVECMSRAIVHQVRSCLLTRSADHGLAEAYLHIYLRQRNNSSTVRPLSVGSRFGDERRESCRGNWKSAVQ